MAAALDALCARAPVSDEFTSTVTLMGGLNAVGDTAFLVPGVFATGTAPLNQPVAAGTIFPGPSTIRKIVINANSNTFNAQTRVRLSVTPGAGSTTAPVANLRIAQFDTGATGTATYLPVNPIVLSSPADVLSVNVFDFNAVGSSGTVVITTVLELLEP